MNKSLSVALVVLAAALSFDSQAALSSPSAKKKSKRNADRISSQQSSPAGESYGAKDSSSPLSGLNVRPILGYQFINPSSMNRRVRETVKEDSAINIGNSAFFGAAVEYPITNEFYAGLRLERFSSSSSSVSLGGDNGTAQTTLSGTPLLATAGYFFPVMPGLKAGPTLGAGWVLGYSASLEISGSKNQNTKNGILEYQDSPFTYLIGAAGQYDFSERVGLRLDLGYRNVVSDQMKATGEYPTVKEGVLFTDNDNKNVKVDASGVFSALSLAVTL